MADDIATLARALLATEMGAAASSSRGVAVGAVQVWDKVARHFARLIGETGIRTLLDRSAILTRSRFPWFTSAPSGSTSLDTSWPALRGSLEQRPANEAAEAFEMLLATFIGLLGRFIGTGLVARLLRELWPDALPHLANVKEAQ